MRLPWQRRKIPYNVADAVEVATQAESQIIRPGLNINPCDNRFLCCSDIQELAVAGYGNLPRCEGRGEGLLYASGERIDLDNAVAVGPRALHGRKHLSP